jgi:subtilisin-like proprotein convertase family protein
MSHPLMKTSYGPWWLPLVGTLTFIGSVSADVWTFSLSPNLAVPDADSNGRVSTLNVSALDYRITDVDVTLTLRGTSFGGWNGDVYAYLSHGGMLSILLNRPGRTASDPLGYPDNGFQAVTFDDEALAGDVHVYQLSWSGSPGPLTGSWEPDARFVDPDNALDTDGRTTYLSVFDGLDPYGDWNLFVADLGSGGEVVLDSWELDLTVEPVPEPATAGLLTGLFSMVWVIARRPKAKPEEIRD